MMLMVSRLAQGFAGEVSGLLGHRFDSSLQVVEFLPFPPFLMPLVVFIIPLDGFQGVDEQGILASTQILRRDSTASPDRSVEVGSTVAIDKPMFGVGEISARSPHARIRLIFRGFSRSSARFSGIA